MLAYADGTNAPHSIHRIAGRNAGNSSTRRKFAWSKDRRAAPGCLPLPSSRQRSFWVVRWTTCLPARTRVPTRRRAGVARCAGLLDHFVVKLDDVLAQDVQHGGTIRCQVIVLAAARAAAGLGFASQPAVAFHAFQERIQRPGADVVAVSPKLREDPLPKHGTFRGVMEDVHFPKPKQNLTREKLRIRWSHSPPL